MKGKNPELKLKCQKMGKEIADGKLSNLILVDNQLQNKVLKLVLRFDLEPKKRLKMFEVGCKHHTEREKKKVDWRTQQLQQSRDQLVVMQNICVSLSCFALTDRDHYAA